VSRAGARAQAARVPFHILGLKCPGCASYNTRRLGVARAPPPAPPQPPLAAGRQL
jgi:transposase-like protein